MELRTRMLQLIENASEEELIKIWDILCKYFPEQIQKFMKIEQSGHTGKQSLSRNQKTQLEGLQYRAEVMERALRLCCRAKVALQEYEDCEIAYLADICYQECIAEAVKIVEQEKSQKI